MSELVQYDANWGAGQDLDKSDLVLPKIMLMQAMSDLVSEGKAKPGDFINSVDGTVLGSKDKGVEVIIFRANKIIQVYNGDEYVRTEPFTAETQSLLYDKSEGPDFRKNVVMNFSVLLPKDVKDGSAFPMILSFKRTSLGAGKKLATLLIRLQMMKKPSAAKVFKISAEQQENDKGKFFTMNVAEGRDTTEQEILDAQLWYKLTEGKKYE